MIRSFTCIALLVTAATLVLSQETDNSLVRPRTGPTIFDEIEDRAERDAFREVWDSAEPRAKRARADAFVERYPASRMLREAYELGARASAELGDHADALRRVRLSLRLLPENPFLLVMMADIAAKQADVSLAELSARDALRHLANADTPSPLAPADWPRVRAHLRATAHFVLGRLAATRGEHAEARQSLLMALASNPAEIDALPRKDRSQQFLRWSTQLWIARLTPDYRASWRISSIIDYSRPTRSFFFVEAHMSRRLISLVAAFGALLTVPLGGTRSTFVPDWTFKGSTLAGWQVLGAADWKAIDGELVGKPKSADGGWLILDKSFQDVEFGADFKCVGACRTGVLLRAEKTPTGMKGVFLSLDEGEVGGYAVTLDANGRILTRERLRPGGGLMRVAPSAAEAAAAAAARGGSAGRGGPGRGAGAAPGGRGRGVLPSGATLPDLMEPTALKPNDWNDLDVVIDANILRPWVNTSGSGGGAADEDLGTFGPIAIYVGGSGQVHFRDVSYRDLSLKRVVPEQLSPNYRMLRLTPFYYSFASGAADFDRDGNMDIVSGPFIFLGPDFTKVREFYMALTTNPSTSFSSNWLEFAGDFTGDGWPDVLLASTSGTRLYVNPKGEPRRWDSYAPVVPPAPNVSEVSVMKDVDADGKPDLVYASAGAVRWAKPDPANPTGPWLSTQVGEPGTYAAHGIGAGDINSDGRVDILNVYGWWEQPANATTGMWTYHPQAFGRQNGRGAPGGAEMCVYDVNGDKLNDVVTSLQAHVFGIAWFEQKRDAGGKISFVRHMISDDFATKNAGGVVFSQPHGSACADMNGDGTTDFVIGKRFFSHNESYADPDPYGAPVLYVYRTVRNKQAPGGAEFVPELVHNQSGAGSQVLAVDLNKDGVMDLVTSGELGAFAFLGQPRRK